MTERRQIVEHAHCEICGRVVRVDERFCSDECKEQNLANLRQKRKQMWIFVAIIVGVVLFVNLSEWGVL